MSEFALFDQALAEYETTRCADEDPLTDEYSEISCDHCDLVAENGIVSCLECGEQIHRTIMHEKEWRFYGTRTAKDLLIRIEYKCASLKREVLTRMLKTWVSLKLLYQQQMKSTLK